MQSQRPEEQQRGDQPLHKSLFRGALRRLAGKQSQGAQEVQVSIASPLPCEMPYTGVAASIVLAVSLAMAAGGTSTIKGATRLREPCRTLAQGAPESLQPLPAVDIHLTALHRVQISVDPLLLLKAVTSRDAVQVPLPSQRVLLWEVELEDGIIVRHHRHFASAACKCSMPLSGYEKQQH